MTIDTRDRIVQAAERLFAQRGIDGVSLREIARESGAKNNVAAQYHFGDRVGVVRAILDKHRPEIEARRHALLDAYGGRDPDVRYLAEALVRPLAAKLADPNGGPEFLQVYADLLNRPEPSVDTRDPSLERWHEAVGRLIDDEARALHRRYSALLFAAVELSRRARSGVQGNGPLSVSSLVDVVAAILEAPVSDETRRAMVSR